MRPTKAEPLINLMLSSKVNVAQRSVGQNRTVHPHHSSGTMDKGLQGTAAL